MTYIIMTDIDENSSEDLPLKRISTPEKTSTSRSRSKPESIPSKSQSRKNELRTFIISIPIGSRPPRIKNGVVKELDKSHTIDEIEQLILESEIVASNIHDTIVQTARCCGNVFKLADKLIK